MRSGRCVEQLTKNHQAGAGLPRLSDILGCHCIFFSSCSQFPLKQDILLSHCLGFCEKLLVIRGLSGPTAVGGRKV